MRLAAVTCGFAISEARGIEPLNEILNEAERLSGFERIKVYLDLMSYIYPKRKPTEQPPFSIADCLQNMKMEDLASLKNEIECRLGENRPLSTLSKEQLVAYKEAIDKAILKIELLERIGNDDYS